MKKGVLMKKAQVAYEFMLIFLILSFGFTIWVVYASSLQAEFQKTKNLQDFEDFALSLKHEIYVVAQMPERFSRTIDLPLRINGITYSISVDENTGHNFSTIFINNTNIGYYTHFDVPKLEGSIKQGKNTLTKNEYNISITQT